MKTIGFLAGFIIAFIVAANSAHGGGITYPPKQVADESSLLTLRPTLNFAGAGVTCADDTTQTTCTIPGGSSGYATIADEGSSLTQRSTLNFIGGSVNCVDNGGSSRTDCTISGGGASPLTTKGDIYVYSTTDDRLPVGLDGECLKANSANPTGLGYGTCSSGGGLAFGEVQRLVFLAQ